MKRYILLFILICSFNFLKAQEDTAVVADPDEGIEYAEKSFWTTRVINGHSLENLNKGELDFRISHRMGRAETGPSGMFGLYQASNQLGLEYGVNNRLMVGIANGVNHKTFLGFFKFKLLRQSSGKKTMPVTLSWYSNVAAITEQLNYPDSSYYVGSRFHYTHQLLIGRKFNDRLTLQFMPTYIHANMVRTEKDANDIFAVGFSGRFKISKKLALTAEYYYLLPNQIDSKLNGQKVSNSLSIGFDIYTGKHVFQLFVTNSMAMDEKSVITETTEKWPEQIHIGFNIARIFTVVDSE